VFAPNFVLESQRQLHILDFFLLQNDQDKIFSEFFFLSKADDFFYRRSDKKLFAELLNRFIFTSEDDEAVPL